MPLRNARQALATSKFWQMSDRPRLPLTMRRGGRLEVVAADRGVDQQADLRRAVDAGVEQRLTAASVAASEACMPASHKRRSWMPAMSFSTSVLMPRRSSVGLEAGVDFVRGQSAGASMWARPAMATCWNNMAGGIRWAGTTGALDYRIGRGNSLPRFWLPPLRLQGRAGEGLLRILGTVESGSTPPFSAPLVLRGAGSGRPEKTRALTPPLPGPPLHSEGRERAASRRSARRRSAARR